MKTIIFVLMLFAASMAMGQTIDLYKLALNDSIICPLTLDKLTDILGRPSRINTKEYENKLLGGDKFGTIIYYHEIGLQFDFYSKELDAKQRIQNVTIYLSKKWDKESAKFFIPFSGKIIPQLNCNMKMKELVNLFGESFLEIQTSDQQKEFYEDISRHRSATPDFPFDEIWIKPTRKESGKIILKCEKATKYLEEVEIFCNMIHDPPRL